MHFFSAIASYKVQFRGEKDWLSFQQTDTIAINSQFWEKKVSSAILTFKMAIVGLYHAIASGKKSENKLPYLWITL